MIQQTLKTEVFTLNDGRALAYIDFGPEEGNPVFYFHGCPSSRYEGEFAAEHARKFGYRIIAPDRPGMGMSDFQKNRKFKDWATDVCSLADHFGFDRFGVAGHSGGGPFVYVCAHQIPERLTFAIAFCPWGPVGDEAMYRTLNSLDRAYFKIAEKMPWLMRATFSPLGFMARRFPQKFFSIMKTNVSLPDKQKLNDEFFYRKFQNAVSEAFRHGSRGAAHEATMCFQKWDFQLDEINFPVNIWAGDEDIWISNEMATYMTQQINRSKLHRLHGKGHLCVEHWEDAFRVEATKS